MALMSDGNSEVGAQTLLFDLVKAFNSIEFIHKSFMRAQHVRSNHLM